MHISVDNLLTTNVHARNSFWRQLCKRSSESPNLRWVIRPGSATCTQPLSHWISCGQCSSSASEWLTEYPGQSATDSVSWWIRWGGDWLNPGSGEPWKGWSTSSYAIVDRPLDQWTSGPTYKRHCRALPLTPPTGQHFPTKGHPGQTLIWEPMVTCFDQDKRNFG